MSNSCISPAVESVTALAFTAEGPSRQSGDASPVPCSPRAMAHVRLTKRPGSDLLAAILITIAVLSILSPTRLSAAPPVPLQFTTFYPYTGGFHQLSGTETGLCTAIGSAEGLRMLWGKMNLPPGTQGPPEVLFEEKTLLVVMLGRQVGACPDVFFQSVIDYGDSLVVTACRVDHQPCPGLDYRPGVFALIPRRSVPTAFRIVGAVQQSYGGCR